MAHIIFIPSPEIGHLVSTVQVAKLLIKRELRLSITILILSSPAESAAALSVIDAGSPDRIELVTLPHDDYLPDPTMSASSSFTGFIDHHKPRVRDFMDELTRTESSTQLAGVVVDMFTTTMMDVADDFGLPSYVFFTSSAASLCLFYHGLNHDLTEFSDSVRRHELIDIPGFANSVPASSIPFVFTDVEWSRVFRTATTRFTRAKGIIVNTFLDLEPVTLKFMSNNDKIPPIYPVGPILNLDGDRRQSEDIISWLDDQPPSSVLFLCFGSRGCFSVAQVAEIARALENSKVRFLWSLRNPSAKMNEVLVGKSIDDDKVILPDGFLESTAVFGKVIGWAPQAAVLAHPSVRGFVSHCGWNSVLESLWCGVPIGAWPLYAEQPINSFQLVKELGLATAMTVDKKNYSSSEVEQNLVTAEEIENGIKQLTAGDCAVLTRENVRKMSEACRMSHETNGSSYVALGRVIEEIMSNIS